MRRVSEYLFLWAVGGCLYYSFELLFRGFSHWSMFVLGGVCFVFFQVQARMLRWQDPLWRQVLRCAVFVTALEFITGIIVNKWAPAGGVGLHRHALPDPGSGMPALYHHLRRALRCGDRPQWISCPLALWGAQALAPCFLDLYSFLFPGKML